MSNHLDPPIHITVPGSERDPRDEPDAPEGVVVHRAPALHPDDVAVVGGLPVTSVARTLVDLADVLPPDELRDTFERARARCLLDMEAVEASYARVEWRPSRRTLRAVMDEFAG